MRYCSTTYEELFREFTGETQPEVESPVYFFHQLIEQVKDGVGSAKQALSEIGGWLQNLLVIPEPLILAPIGVRGKGEQRGVQSQQPVIISDGKG